LTIKKADTGRIEIVELTRTLTATIADKRRLFDLFCEIENAFLNKMDYQKSSAIVSEAMELWTKMELEQVKILCAFTAHALDMRAGLQ
jgi:hypothetical protein